MNSVAIRVLALSLIGAVYLGPWHPADASTATCHQSCTAPWKQERAIAIDTYVACEAGCAGLSSEAAAACSAQCFRARNAALAQADAELKQCFRTCP